MNNEKDFYGILHSKFDNSEAPVDEENWTKMRKMIDASRAAKNRAVWLAVSFGLLLFAGGTFAFYEWSTGKEFKNITAQSSPVNSILNNSHTINTTQHANYTKTITTIAPIREKTDTRAVTLNSQPTKTGTGAFHENTIHNTRNNLLSNTQNNITGKGSSIAITENNTILPEKNLPENNMADKTQSVNPIPESKQTVTVASNSAIKVPAHVASTTNKADSAVGNEALPPRFSYEPRIFRGKTNILSFEAGAEYSGGWQVGSVIQGKGYNLIIGGAYTHYLGSKWFIKTGLQFSTFGNMGTLNYNYQRSVSKVGSTVIYDSVITTERLYFLRLPVQAEYFIGNKNSLGVGGSVWFLLGNSGYATTYQEVDNLPPSNAVRYSQNASLNGYNKVNLSGHILYRHTFSQHISVYGIIYYEFTNMKSNTFFDDNIIDKTKGFQILASYSL